jgi:hypothetical protein
MQALQAYAPELDPTEQAWNDLKSCTANNVLWGTRDLCQQWLNMYEY